MEVTVVTTDSKTLDQLIDAERARRPTASDAAIARIVCRSLDPHSLSRLLLEALLAKLNASKG